jgi:hypothetical protein
LGIGAEKEAAFSVTRNDDRRNPTLEEVAAGLRTLSLGWRHSVFFRSVYRRTGGE